MKKNLLKISYGKRLTSFTMTIAVVQVLGSLGSLFVGAVTARLLGPQGRGELTLLVLLCALAVSIGRCGVAHSVFYYVAKTEKEVLIRSIIFLTAVLSLLTFAIAVAMVFLTHKIFFPNFGFNILLIACCSIPLYMFYLNFIALFQAMRQLTRRNAQIILHPCLNLSIFCVLVFFYAPTVFNAFFAWVGASIICVCLAIYQLRSVIFKRIKINIPFVRNLLSFGFKSHMGNLLKDMLYRVDMFLVNFFLGSAAVGYYFVGVTLAECIWLIPEVVGTVLSGTLGRLSASMGSSLTAVSSKIVYLFSLCACIFVLVFRRIIIVLIFGKQFLPAEWALVALMPGVVMLAVWKVVAMDLIVRGYPLKFSFTALIAFVSMVIFDFIFIPMWGIVGASVASTLAYALATYLIVMCYVSVTKGMTKFFFIPSFDELFQYARWFRI